ncbi:MAG: hypothetical protein KGI27_01725 [Thaumarchaeota archaeon]|nr:hypothetical protein [Nitrososphaerota archaeon]
MDIKTSVVTWILSYLYNQNVPIPRKDLLKKLCNASFDSMTGSNDFDSAIKQLTDAKYIENTTREVSEYVPVIDNLNLPEEEQTNKLQEMKHRVEGIVITEDGIFEYRKQIGTPLEKIQPHLDKVSASPQAQEFKGIIKTLKFSDDVIGSAVKLCIENAPLIVKFIKEVPRILTSFGVNIQS